MKMAAWSLNWEGNAVAVRKFPGGGGAAVVILGGGCFLAGFHLLLTRTPPEWGDANPYAGVGMKSAAGLDMAHAIDAMRLLRSRRVGAVTWHRLIDEHGSAAAALSALPEVAAQAGVQDYAICPEAVVLAEIERGYGIGARLLLHGQADYPAALAELSDAPPVLWALGDADLLRRPMVAVVGARNASSLGLRMARLLAEGLSQAGQVVVSGLARGIDTVAHEASLGGGTVAVLAGGVDCAHSEENAPLYGRLRAQGCLLSEQPPGSVPQPRLFPARNRIISGLSRGVVVVEAAARSGSLITAREALDQGRDVLVVPGHPFDARVSGCNLLIRDGATLIRGPADVLDALNLPAQVSDGARRAEEPVAQPAGDVGLTATAMAAAQLAAAGRAGPRLRQIAQLHRKILDRLGSSAVAEDQLARDLCLSPSTISQQLVTLEVEGRVARAAGGMIRRAD